jgi:hypothetical protein
VKIAFAEWVALCQDLRRAGGAREVLGLLFGPPGWRADGTGRTTRAIRRAAGIPDDSRSRRTAHRGVVVERDAAGG